MVVACGQTFFVAGPASVLGAVVVLTLVPTIVGNVIVEWRSWRPLTTPRSFFRRQGEKTPNPGA
jgi:hypothetical protein